MRHLTKLIVSLMVVFISLKATSSPLEARSDTLQIAWSQVLSEPTDGVDWSPNGTFIVFANPDARQIVLLDWQSRAVIWRTTVPDDIQVGIHSFFMRWSPDGNFIAATISAHLYRLDAETGQLYLLQARNESASGATGYQQPRWSPDSTLIAALNTEGFIEIFSVTTGERIQTIDIQGEYHVGGFRYTGFDWSPDGQIFATPRHIYESGISADQDNQVGFWDQAGNLLTAYSPNMDTDVVHEPLCLSRYADGLLAGYDDIEWANDSRTLAVTGMWGYGICRLNIDGTTDDYPISDEGITTLRWSPDQRWLVGVLNSSPGIWVTDTANDNYTVELSTDAVQSGIDALAWSPDSQWLAVGTSWGLWIGNLRLIQN